MDAAPRRIRDYFKRYKWAFGFGIACLIITQGFTLWVPRLLKQATDGIVDGEIDQVKQAAMGMVAAALFGALARIASRIFIFNSGRDVEHDLRHDLFAHLERQGQNFFDQMPQGQVMSRMVNDLTQVRLLLGPGLLNITNAVLVYSVVLPLLLYTDWELTLWALMPLPAIILMGRVTGGKLFTYNREAQERLGELSTRVQENLSGTMTVRAYVQEASEEKRFQEQSDKYLDVNIKLARLRGFMFPSMGLAGSLSSVIILWMGGHRIASGAMTVGGFVEFSAYLAALTWPTAALGWIISLWQRGKAAMERVNQIFTAEPNLQNGSQVSSQGEGHIELRDLSYSYPGNELPTLKGITTEIKPGETVVIVGRTGCGKSTLLKLLARLLPVQSEQMYFDGKDVNKLTLGSVRETISYAPRDAFLFSRTIAENVAFGAPESSESRVSEALEMAAFDTEVAAFPEGFNTVVGERGITLSGGQRQRTTLARAFLVERPVLILDDTLSAVDTETETEILGSLRKTQQKQTLIMATHRLACAAQADRILVLDQGELVEQGNEAELLALDGIYAQMYRRQRREQDLEDEQLRERAV